MSDDLDDLLRSTMKTLDDQVPSDYFDGLPTQTLARLEATMATGTPGPTNREPAAASSARMVAATAAPPPRDAVVPVVPPRREAVATATPLPVEATPPVAREEDSGLHDIRSLAQSTKQRLTTKRVTTNPPMGDELVASSGAWKHVALPEPAKMVSLPSLDELPLKQEVRAAAKAANQPAMDVAAAVAPVGAPQADLGAEASFAKPAFSAWADRAPKQSRTGLYAVIGMGLAAAAGALIFVKTQGADKAAPAQSSNNVAPATGAAETQRGAAREQGAAAPAALPAEAKPAAEPTAGVADTTTSADGVTTRDQVEAPSKATAKAIGHGAKSKGGDPQKPDPKSDKDTTEKKDVKIDTGKKGGGKEAGDPSFDELLKEAGVDGVKKVDKPKLDKKSLSEADFKHGIGAVAAKAAGCYKGTQGTATVKLTVAPSGQVSKVSVGGVFADKPEADCVANAVKTASFPPWDGGPQSFSYAYLLSE